MSSKGKILVVEDNNFVRMQIVKFLTDDGFECQEATDGQQALDVVNDEFELAVVDVRMEPLDGFDFVRAIAAREFNVPVILVTGDDNPDLLSKATELSVLAVLMKPVQKDRLLKMADRAVTQKRRAS